MTRSKSEREKQAALHNVVAPAIVRQIVKPIIDNGGTEEDIMILTESVLFGVVLLLMKLGGDKKLLDIMVGRVRKRLAEHRLTSIKTKGSA